jgi:hypothetical protein
MSYGSLVCDFHPDCPAIGFNDVPDEVTGVMTRVGFCVECAVTCGHVDGPVPMAFEVISNGKPCHCGPGFCAGAAGVGYYGFCDGSKSVSAPDCLACGAPHQSTTGCWACGTRSGEPNLEGARDSIYALERGVRFDEVFELQEELSRKGIYPTFRDLIDRVALAKSHSTKE